MISHDIKVDARCESEDTQIESVSCAHPKNELGLLREVLAMVCDIFRYELNTRPLNQRAWKGL